MPIRERTAETFPTPREPGPGPFRSLPPSGERTVFRIHGKTEIARIPNVYGHANHAPLNIRFKTIRDFRTGAAGKKLRSRLARQRPPPRRCGFCVAGRARSVVFLSRRRRYSVYGADRVRSRPEQWAPRARRAGLSRVPIHDRTRS